MDEQARYERARKRVEEIKGFYTHLLIYVLVNAGLLLINLVTDRGDWWFFYPLFGWGIGIVAHAVSVFGIWGFAWEERKIKAIMDRERSGE
jgi:hypothetical protein